MEGWTRISYSRSAARPFCGTRSVCLTLPLITCRRERKLSLGSTVTLSSRMMVGFKIYSELLCVLT
ncbi:hypothetical protein BOSE127_180064 [Bosea sp. 127]|nr:hypothetical protein BOSE127_180064 [Bosea sp. 127]